MGKIEPQLDDTPGNGSPVSPPRPRTALFFDGYKWHVPRVDADGHVQIDVLSTLMDARAATEATLAEVSARLGDETSPAAGSVNAQLATLATEVKLEAARVLLNTLAGKDFATQTTLAALLVELALKADLTETQPVRGKDQLLSYKQPLKSGIRGIVSGANGWVDSASPANGLVWAVTQVAIRNRDNPFTSTVMRVWDTVDSYYFLKDHTWGEALEWTGFPCNVYLEHDDVIRVNFVGCLIDDECDVDLTGHVMTKE